MNIGSRCYLDDSLLETSENEVTHTKKKKTFAIESVPGGGGGAC